MHDTNLEVEWLLSRGSAMKTLVSRCFGSGQLRLAPSISGASGDSSTCGRITSASPRLVSVGGLSEGPPRLRRRDLGAAMAGHQHVLLYARKVCAHMRVGTHD